MKKLIRKRTWQDWSVRSDDWEQDLLDNGFSFFRQSKGIASYELFYVELGSSIR